MKKRITWFSRAVRHTIRNKIPGLGKHIKYVRRGTITCDEASEILAERLKSNKPFMAGRLGFSETGVMRMYEFEIKKKYATTINIIYNWSGFFPNDIKLGHKFLDVMKDAIEQTDVFACNRQFLEDYFIDTYLPKESKAVENFQIFEPYSPKNSWTSALKGKKVLVVSSFSKSVEHQYARREEIYPGTDILPEFTLLTYQSLVTLGDMEDNRFETWFDALDFMKTEILAMDFDVALVSCGAYAYPLCSEIKKAGKQAICMGGVLQILFGIMGRRWDGSRFGGIEHMDENLKRYYNDSWIYPLEERPKAADKVEYGPYWK